MEPQVKKTSPFRYAIGMFGTSIPINMFKTFSAIFYVDKLGLDTASYSLVLFIYTFIDAADNSIYGYLSDRTRTRWGRRRPWLVIGAPLLGLSFLAFFNPPQFLIASNWLFIYFFISYILTGTLDSLVNANYGALFPELFPSDAERASTNAMRQAFQLVAMVISIALTPMVASRIGYSTTALLYGILGASVIIYSTIGCHENPQYLKNEKPQLWDSIKSLAKNKKFWIAGFTNAFYSATMSLVMAGITFYTKYALKIKDSQSTYLLGTVLFIAIGAVAIWAQLIKKKTLIPVWRGALMVLGIGFIPLYFANSLITAIIASSVVGFGFAGVIATMDLIGARIIDEDAQKSGTHREGIYSGVGGFMNRMNGLFTSLAFLLVNRLYGFKSGKVPGPNPGAASKFLLIIFPFILMVISCIFSRFLNFPEKSIKESKTLKSREV
ncbi:MAG: MFS transporter [Clostridiales bacterium]|nr:MFS transporter [Clostridiales bacterium]HBM80826.1 MFS transporter [Clostridiaceae bacterium]